MKIAENTWVKLTYRILDDEGNEVESSGEEAVTYHHGQGELLEGLEEALEGGEAGQELEVELRPEQAYGSTTRRGSSWSPGKSFPTTPSWCRATGS